MKTTVKHFNELTPEELYGILQLRERVFTFEQRCSEPDLDGFDKVAYHIFLTDENGTEAVSANVAERRFARMKFLSDA